MGILVKIIELLGISLVPVILPGNRINYIEYNSSLLPEQQEKRNELLEQKYPSVLSFCQKDWSCSICLENIKEDEKYKMLRCNHYYHEDCIKTWIIEKGKDTCPLCKSTLW